MASLGLRSPRRGSAARWKASHTAFIEPAMLRPAGADTGGFTIGGRLWQADFARLNARGARPFTATGYYARARAGPRSRQ